VPGQTTKGDTVNKKMRKYLVGVREVHIQTIEILATSEKEAIRKVAEGNDNQEEISLDYSHTLDEAAWTVEEAGK
jgi:hypothetical protein